MDPDANSQNTFAAPQSNGSEQRIANGYRLTVNSSLTQRKNAVICMNGTDVHHIRPNIVSLRASLKAGHGSTQTDFT